MTFCSLCHFRPEHPPYTPFSLKLKILLRSIPSIDWCNIVYRQRSKGSTPENNRHTPQLFDQRYNSPVHLLLLTEMFSIKIQLIILNNFVANGI